MKRNLLFKSLVILSCFMFNMYAVVGQDNKALPTVTILATGGTIAGSASSGAQSGYTSGQVTIDAMVNSIPEVKKIAKITGEQISNVGSQDISFDIMLKLANRIAEIDLWKRLLTS